VNRYQEEILALTEAALDRALREEMAARISGRTDDAAIGNNLLEHTIVVRAPPTSSLVQAIRAFEAEHHVTIFATNLSTPERDYIITLTPRT
jgi:hypothetical protein